MSSSIADVRAEIKKWERNFRVEHGKDASVQDIKDNPAIAAKYKLYKKLSKAAASSSAGSSRDHSVERRVHAPSLLPNSRLIQTTSPLSTFNPFSPRKKAQTKKLPNPFATPTKSKSRAESTLPHAIPTSPSPQPIPSAVSRARKRLRGEPVSPSPSKEKRRRVVHQPLHAGSSDEDSHVLGHLAASSSFVDDSPVKGSSFKMLFQDSGASVTHKTTRLSKASSSASGLFGERSRSVSLGVDDDWDMEPPLKPVRNGKAKVQVNGKSFHSRALPGKDNLHSADHAVEVALSQERTKPVKRPFFEDDDMEPTPAEGTILIPPSPPPRSSHQNGNAKSKGPHKKPKTMQDDHMKGHDDDDDDESDDLKERVKLVSPPTLRRSADSDDLDMKLDYSRRPVGYSPDLSPGREEVDSRVEIQLPEQLLQVLELSSSESKTRDSAEQRVATELIYGRREGHYYPLKGGEVWEVGEDVNPTVDEGEDDWEGEPVPWEVGEL